MRDSPPDPARPDTARLAALDGLRGVAALAICLLHLAHVGHHRLSANLGEAWLAVDFFFVLSGVVIADRYAAHLLQGGYLRAFAWRRVIRLYPMVVLGTVMGAGAIVLGRALHTGPAPHFGDLAFATLWNGLLLPLAVEPWWGWGVWPINPPFWSLFCEVVVNALYALTIAHLRGWRIALPIAAALAILVVHCASGLPLQFRSAGTGLVICLARAVFGFGLGVVLARLHRAGRLPRFAWAGWPAVAALVVVLWAPWRQGPGAVYELLAIALVLPLIVAAALGAAPGLRSVRLFSLIGLISYPLYATHEVLFRAVRSTLESRHAAALLLRDDVLAGLLVLAVLLAYGLARFYDQPVRAWLSRRLARPGLR